jgi:hypothetical protein
MFKPTYHTFGLTSPATVSKSIGLLANSQAVMVFAMPLRQFYRDMTNPAHLSGFSTLTAISLKEKTRVRLPGLAKTTSAADTNDDKPVHFS